ncbi:hypothetical protein AB0J55_01110 [Amycolatopsis sp. NPDC049688]|uniref:hypothetical protein n=1 Tax=Amycolatopsis sp. NPDC049688 TaxID=3154733 RepID=UPI0034369544
MRRVRQSEEPSSDPVALTRDQRFRGARLVASAANDAEDCALLLAVLGLEPADGLPGTPPPPG